MEFYDFPIYRECHHPNWRTPSFFRGVGSTTKHLREHGQLQISWYKKMVFRASYRPWNFQPISWYKEITQVFGDQKTIPIRSPWYPQCITIIIPHEMTILELLNAFNPIISPLNPIILPLTPIISPLNPVISPILRLHCPKKHPKLCIPMRARIRSECEACLTDHHRQPLSRCALAVWAMPVGLTLWCNGCPKFPLVGWWKKEGFEETPLTTGRWWWCTKSAPLFSPKRHYWTV